MRAAPISECGPITEDSHLVGDLISVGTCLTIEKDNIVLDCMGHSITGDGTGFGIELDGRMGVTVVNCVVGNFEDGIFCSIQAIII